jgi:hypothetical protein
MFQVVFPNWLNACDERLIVGARGTTLDLLQESWNAP